jgi:hypothetical protein
LEVLIIMIDTDSFSHGQIKSKIWLCENLEPNVLQDATVMILGCWIDITGFIMMSRQPKLYRQIKGIDIDSEAIAAADKINSYSVIECIMRHEVGDANTVSSQGFDVVINCSCEHMDSSIWFDNITAGTLVCIQSSNIVDSGYPWYVNNPSPTYESFIEKYPLTHLKFAGTLPINYDDWGYERYMIIGIK